MGKRGPKGRETQVSDGVAPLESRNIVIGERRTSMRLEPSMWEAISEIGRREQMSVSEICTAIYTRLLKQAELRGKPLTNGEVTLTSAVRAFLVSYYRNAGTDEGHRAARHGLGDPFIGTPFDLHQRGVAELAGGPASAGEVAPLPLAPRGTSVSVPPPLAGQTVQLCKTE